MNFLSVGVTSRARKYPRYLKLKDPPCIPSNLKGESRVRNLRLRQSVFLQVFGRNAKFPLYPILWWSPSNLNIAPITSFSKCLPFCDLLWCTRSYSRYDLFVSGSWSYVNIWISYYLAMRYCPTSILLSSIYFIALVMTSHKYIYSYSRFFLILRMISQ